MKLGVVRMTLVEVKFEASRTFGIREVKSTGLWNLSEGRRGRFCVGAKATATYDETSRTFGIREVKSTGLWNLSEGRGSSSPR